MKPVWSHWRSRWAAFLHDFLSIPLAWFGAYWLRFNLSEIPSEILSQALAVLPWVMVIQTAAFWTFGLYRGVWRFASLPDLTRIIKAIVIGCLFSLLAAFLITRLENIPRSVIPLYGILLLFILGGSRFLYRWFKDKRTYSVTGNRVLIVGAGSAGESLVRDLLRNKSQYLPVAIVDDNPRNMGRELQGIRVVGKSDDIPDVVMRFDIDMILIAMPSANASLMRRIAAICEKTKKPVRTLPSTNDLVTGAVSIKNLRAISLADLLGRDPVSLDWQAIKGVIANKSVLISGGGGSIGSELCRQVIQLQPSHLTIVDNSEYNLFHLQQEFANKFLSSRTKVHFYLMDLCDKTAINHLFKQYRPQVVFHAAAYKHVPLLEPQIRAATRNNVVGSYYLAEAASTYGVEKFVMVSTDKAVNPTNVMGATKRIAELVCQYFNQKQGTRFVIVRFGNVLGSRGSVVETFQQQLELGGPLTVTHPDVTRYFMTIQEASQLIMQALSIGKGGELFVLDMGEPIKIRYMAEQMIRLAGKRGEDIQIDYIGLRPGEKLYEELFHEREKLKSTSHEKILRAEPRSINDYALEKNLIAIQHAIEECNEQKLFLLIKALVPEFLGTKVFETKPVPSREVMT